MYYYTIIIIIIHTYIHTVTGPVGSKHCGISHAQYNAYGKFLDVDRPSVIAAVRQYPAFDLYCDRQDICNRWTVGDIKVVL